MESKKFIELIRKEYLNARKAIIEDIKIIRGTSRSISSLAEDIFGKYVADLISENYEIWIDPQISVKNIRNTTGKRTKVFRPDVCVYNKTSKVVEMIFDLKMDLGYKRTDFIEYTEERYSELQDIILNEGSWTKDKEEIKFTFSKNIKWNYLVLSEDNITKLQMNKIKEHFKICENSELFILSSGEHLNSYNNNPQFLINESAFNSINSIVKKTCG